MKHREFKFCVATAAMVMASSMAVAQQPDGQPRSSAASQATSDQNVTLEEVIVTAERRTEDLQRTALSVSVRSGEDLLQQGKFTLSQIVEDVPNVYIAPLGQAGTNNATDNPATAITIRGIGSNGRVPGNGTVVPAVALYVDGVNGGVGGTYDIKNVQVLRGPQGTLYGRSATAGVVAIQTNDPVLGQLTGNVALEAGNYDLIHYTGAVSIPLGDSWAVRVAGNQYQQQGYYSREGGKINTTDGRVKLLFKPNDQFSLLLGYALQNNDEHSGGNQGTQEIDGSVNYDFVVPTGTGKDETRQYWAQAEWDLGPATLTYLPAYRTYEQNCLCYSSPTFGAVAVSTQSFPTDHYHTQELRFTSNASSGIKWQTGLFYYDNLQKYNFSFNATVPGLPFPFYEYDVNKKRTSDEGVFGEATFPWADTWRLTTGLRYDHTKVKTSKTEDSNIVDAFFTPYSLTLSEDQGTRTWNNWTYKLRLEHDLTASNLLYAAVTTGFLPGDTSISPQNGVLTVSPYQAETLTSYEIGSKNRFLADSLQINGDVFYYRYGAFQQVLQQAVGVIQLPSGIGASPARMIGAELEAIYQFTPADSIALNVGYTDAYYQDKPADVAESITQSHVPGIAPWTVDSSYTRTFRLSDKQSIRFQAQALYTSPHDVSSIDSTHVGQDFYYRNKDEVTGNLYLTWQYAQYSLAGYVRNVSDERFKASVGTMSATTGGLHGPTALSPPRTFGVVISAGF